MGLGALGGIYPVYVGIAHPIGYEWALFMEWRVMNRPFIVKERWAKDLEMRKALGSLALNLAHYVLKHGPRVIHLPKSYKEARRLALRWGFKREIEEMERTYVS